MICINLNSNIAYDKLENLNDYEHGWFASNWFMRGNLGWRICRVSGYETRDIRTLLQGFICQNLIDNDSNEYEYIQCGQYLYDAIGGHSSGEISDQLLCFQKVVIDICHFRIDVVDLFTLLGEHFKCCRPNFFTVFN